MKFQNLSVKRLFGRVAIGLVLSMSGITIALFLVTKQTAVLLTGGALLLCALVGIFVLTQAFGKRLSQFTRKTAARPRSETPARRARTDGGQCPRSRQTPRHLTRRLLRSYI